MDISRILQKIRPNCFYSINGNTYEGLVWESHNTEVKPSIEEVIQAWELVKNEIGWESIRIKRNKLLQESDYTQLQDYKGNSEIWKNYRQNLRNIPQTWLNPDLVIWPQKPD